MWKHLKWLILLIIIAIISVAIINRNWIYDWWRGINYKPSAEMAAIQDSLKLTDRGNFIFKASHPTLDDSETFNASCKSAHSGELAVLGCYTEDEIHVYNIQSEELKGIRELTTAHELLHANWKRMSKNDKHTLLNELNTIDINTNDKLTQELNNYSTDQQSEELYVRAGTEIKDLPSNLEKHYGDIFQNQDLIVSYYDSYITVFLEIETEMNQLMSEMQSIQQEIDNTTIEYEQRASQLSAAVTSFNICAEQAGCFKSEYDFYSKRANLLNEQSALETIYNHINTLIDEYNIRVEKYNADVTRTDKLNQAINSTKKTQGL